MFFSSISVTCEQLVLAVASHVAIVCSGTLQLQSVLSDDRASVIQSLDARYDASSRTLYVVAAFDNRCVCVWRANTLLRRVQLRKAAQVVRFGTWRDGSLVVVTANRLGECNVFATTNDDEAAGSNNDAEADASGSAEDAAASENAPSVTTPLLQFGHCCAVNDVYVDDAGARVATVDRDDKLRVSAWPSTPLRIVCYGFAHTGAVTCVRGVPSAPDLLATCSLDGRVVVWRASSAAAADAAQRGLSSQSTLDAGTPLRALAVAADDAKLTVAMVPRDANALVQMATVMRDDNATTTTTTTTTAQTTTTAAAAAVPMTTCVSLDAAAPMQQPLTVAVDQRTRRFYVGGADATRPLRAFDVADGAACAQPALDALVATLRECIGVDAPAFNAAAFNLSHLQKRTEAIDDEKKTSVAAKKPKK